MFGIHFDRASGRHRNHRDPRQLVVAGTLEREGIGQVRQMQKQPSSDRAGDESLHYGSVGLPQLRNVDPH